MSTRSAIICQTAAGFSGIYCHSDGYPAWVGFLLQQHFNTPEKAAALVALGDISGIGRNGEVDAYHRDSGEKWENVSPVESASLADIFPMIANDGHVYAFASGAWTHNQKPLLEVLARPEIKAETASMHPSGIPDTPPATIAERTASFSTANRMLPFAPSTKAPVKSLDEIFPPIAAKPPSMKQRIAAGIAALTALQPFIGLGQSKVIATLIRTSEEQDFFIDKMIELAAQVEAMPHTYQQEGLGEQAIAHLHYFIGGCDWWITEKDMGDKEDPAPNLQLQAFGYACLGDPDFAELGYISLPEILEAGAELDLHWNPTAMAEIKAKLFA